MIPEQCHGLVRLLNFLKAVAGKAVFALPELIMKLPKQFD